MDGSVPARHSISWCCGILGGHFFSLHGVDDMQVCAFVYLRNIYSVVLQIFVVKMGHGKLLIKLGVC